MTTDQLAGMPPTDDAPLARFRRRQPIPGSPIVVAASSPSGEVAAPYEATATLDDIAAALAAVRSGNASARVSRRAAHQVLGFELAKALGDGGGGRVVCEVRLEGGRVVDVGAFRSFAPVPPGSTPAPKGKTPEA